LEIDDFQLVCNRSQLQQKVILPYIKRLNRELNVLLSYTPVGTQGINQIIVTGGTSGLKEFKEWLEQKFTNAVIIQDNYKDGGLKTCSRVAHGLAILPMYPQLLERSQQQYSDYFLLWELLQVVTIKGNDLSEILQLLERRGINTRICKEKILGFLDGKMPRGLIPTLNYPQLLHQSAWQNLDYQVLSGEDIFIKDEDNLYRINNIQQEHLIRYLSTLYSGTLQKISEPLILEL
ncbi:MAG TPA: hypothetical protein V6C58_02965, partial [Allocoleopsis sp.]